MKITCDVIQDLMPSYIDGILSEDSKVLVEEHMGTCQECRKMLEIMKEEQGKEQVRIKPSAASTAERGAGETENTESNANAGSVASPAGAVVKSVPAFAHSPYIKKTDSAP